MLGCPPRLMATAALSLMSFSVANPTVPLSNLAIYAHPLEYAEHCIFEGMGINSHIENM
jgi:hypothetical protein